MIGATAPRSTFISRPNARTATPGLRRGNLIITRASRRRSGLFRAWSTSKNPLKTSRPVRIPGNLLMTARSSLHSKLRKYWSASRSARLLPPKPRFQAATTSSDDPKGSLEPSKTHSPRPFRRRLNAYPFGASRAPAAPSAANAAPSAARAAATSSASDGSGVAATRDAAARSRSGTPAARREHATSTGGA